MGRTLAIPIYKALLCFVIVLFCERYVCIIILPEILPENFRVWAVPCLDILHVCALHVKHFFSVYMCVISGGVACSEWNL